MGNSQVPDGSMENPDPVETGNQQMFTLPDELTANGHDNSYSVPPDSLTVFQIMLLRSLESIAQQLDRIRQRLDANAEGK